MRLAIVVGGWHWPWHPFWKLAAHTSGADLFAIAHRPVDLSIVREEKRAALRSLTGELGKLDRELYDGYATLSRLREWGWRYQEEPNTVGDWGFLNQWLATHDYRKYDVILNCHDDTYFRSDCDPTDWMFARKFFVEDWLVIGHSKYPEAPLGYLRGSFEFWSRELLDMLGGTIPLGDPALTRIGKTDTPEGMAALSSWNATCDPLRKFMVEQKLTDRMHYLSPYYRISPWVIEGERGLLSNQGGAPWSFEAGLEAYPLEVAA